MAQEDNAFSEDSIDALNALSSKAEDALKEAASGFIRLEIKPYELKDESRVYGATKTVGINPESYTRKFSSNTRQKTLTKADGKVYDKKIVELVETVAFTLWFDGTGAIPKTEEVETDLNWFIDNLAKYDGKIHATRYVELSWGALKFNGQIKSIDFEYLMFNRNGSPLRAKASLVFESILEKKVKEKLRQDQSPDLTHQRIVKAGDTLPLMCYDIYNNPYYYLQVAEANNLPNFTHIEPGQKIYFPPLR